MNKPHKCADVIKAWADGAEVECKNIFIQGSHWGPWNEEEGPINWNDPNYIFRVMHDPVITTKYFQKVSATHLINGTHITRTEYVEFQPDLEKWDLRITYVDDSKVIDVKHI